MRQNQHKTLIFLLLLCVAIPVWAAARGAVIRTVGVAPLLGDVWTVGELQRLSSQNQDLILEAVRQAGHNQEVARLVLKAMIEGQVQDVPGGLPDGTVLQTMGWYGVNRNRQQGVHTLYTPQMATGRSVPAWAFEVEYRGKVIVWVVPKKCGNLSRLKVYVPPPPTEEPPPPPTIEEPPPPVGFYWGGASPRSKVSTGSTQYLGSTVSGLSLRWTPNPKAPVTNVNVSNVAKNNNNNRLNNGNNINLNNSNQISNINNNANLNVNDNVNNNNNTNNNMNNNAATAQAQNLNPVNVLVNTGDGDVNGSATAEGVQGSNTGQSNF